MTSAPGHVVADTIRFLTVHRTDYSYGSSMSDGYTVAHVLPRDTPHQRVESASVEVEPQADELEEHLDAFGNRVVRLGMHHPHDRLSVVGRSVVSVDVVAPDAPSLQDGPTLAQAVDAVRHARGDRAVEIGPFVGPTPATPSSRQLDALIVRGLSRRIHAEFRFDPEFSNVSTPIADVLEARRGVCQDFAHLAIAMLRSCGLAARYVSGYLETTPPPGQHKLTGSDASHAWCSVWSPAVGWIDLDPTNDQVPPQRHITVGWGRDYFDVTPVRGVVIGPTAKQTLDVGVDVTAIG
ncbi:MAG: transglutaminase family protein [Actinobacteria bacterium]|nr:transglutaminase family protein [Actinomycetota bacterium]